MREVKYIAGDLQTYLRYVSTYAVTLNQLLYHVHKLIQNACHCQNVSYPYVESCYIRRLPCVGDPLAYKMSWGRENDEISFCKGAKRTIAKQKSE